MSRLIPRPPTGIYQLPEDLVAVNMRCPGFSFCGVDACLCNKFPAFALEKPINMIASSTFYQVESQPEVFSRRRHFEYSRRPKERSHLSGRCSHCSKQ